MATGKTAVGHLLAKKMKMKYVSTDSLVEKRAECKISTIFKKHGEAYFRLLETKAIRSLNKKTGCVISCGGGIILKSVNRKILKSLGKIIWLKAKPEIINKRLKSLRQRPLLNIDDDKKRLVEIKKILSARNPIYSKVSDHVIDTSSLTLNGVVDKIIDL